MSWLGAALEKAIPRTAEVGLEGGEKASRCGSEGLRGFVGERRSVRYGGGGQLEKGFVGDD